MVVVVVVVVSVVVSLFAFVVVWVFEAGVDLEGAGFEGPDLEGAVWVVEVLVSGDPDAAEWLPEDAGAPGAEQVAFLAWPGGQ